MRRERGRDREGERGGGEGERDERDQLLRREIATIMQMITRRGITWKERERLRRKNNNIVMIHENRGMIETC